MPPGCSNLKVKRLATRCRLSRNIPLTRCSDWQVNDALSANVNWTLYGRQKPRQYAEIRNETGTLATTEVGAYSIVGIGTQYQLNRDIRLNAGISNLFDKQLYRENAGASTYNEPGRAYYAGVTLSF
ncbi:outer Membrane Siderophore Receptor IroN [Klebsiella pneumoniae]|uniref:Outer Membrane Siderophore Receptor IroN n=1 Tax=Klebsiella pneumoniae TaxID=573 RepID=A0A2X3F1B5_KLEPN|nr:outer Membrane Siderophore Receptor IroN [Klebsiella pneumoniae]